MIDETWHQRDEHFCFASDRLNMINSAWSIVKTMFTYCMVSVTSSNRVSMSQWNTMYCKKWTILSSSIRNAYLIPFMRYWTLFETARSVLPAIIHVVFRKVKEYATLEGHFNIFNIVEHANYLSHTGYEILSFIGIFIISVASSTRIMRNKMTPKISESWDEPKDATSDSIFYFKSILIVVWYHAVLQVADIILKNQILQRQVFKVVI